MLLDIVALIIFIAIASLTTRRTMQNRTGVAWAILAYLIGLVTTVAVGEAIRYLALLGEVPILVRLGDILANLSFWGGLVGPGIGLWLAYRARSTSASSV